LIIEKTDNVWWADSLKNMRKYHKMTLDDVENITGIAKTIPFSVRKWKT